MDHATHNTIVPFIWGIADVVMHDLSKRDRDPDVILPMCVLQRMDVVLEHTNKALIDPKKMVDDAGFTEQQEVVPGYRFPRQQRLEAELC